jgi:hypothetical protein
MNYSITEGDSLGNTKKPSDRPMPKNPPPSLSKKPIVDIYFDEERNDTNIEFYIDPNHTLSISLDPTSNIDWAYLWGEHKDCGHGSQFVRKDIKYAGLRDGKIVEFSNDKLSLNHDHIDQIIEIELEGA